MRAGERFHRAVLGVAVLGCLSCGARGHDDASAVAQTSGAGPAERRANRLAGETSPYLLLHAHNPVDWYPWGPEALERAKAEDKPIFLSIGYSSCYWCHVMERLVFENEKIAAYMNEHFINIKVDREERPDLDDIYMTALQVYFQAAGVNQGGGWPLSMFLTPGGKPFVGGTYFPPEDEGGRVGFHTVLGRVNDLWHNRRVQIDTNAEILASEVRRVMSPGAVLVPVELDARLVDAAVQAVVDSYDAQHGGIDFNSAQPDGPKFPTPGKLALLQHDVARRGNDRAAGVLEHTLQRMAAGGIRDHLGGGFHRYSTDRRWHVPHFEKMLYDQAQLVDLYAREFARTGNPLFRQVVEETFAFLSREMTDQQGGFYSALDAETDGVEGQYYVWSREEIEKILGPDDAKLFGRVYGLDAPQVFEHGYVLHLPQSLDEVAGELQIPADELHERLARWRAKLLEVRNERQPLLRDDKILTSWNGLMIRGLAHAGRLLEREDYIHSAERAADFVLKHLRDDQGRLLRTYRNGQGRLNAYLDDYAFFVEGLLALHSATDDEKWLHAARELTDLQIDLYGDDSGGFYFTSDGHEELLVRMNNAYDGVIPSGNSASVRNLLRLAELTGEDSYRDKAAQTLRLFASHLERNPSGLTSLALGLGEYLGDPDQLALAPPADEEKSEDEILQAAAESESSEKKDELVTARAFLSVDKLSAGKTCEVVVLLNVQRGWHVNSNPQSPDFLIPTTLTLNSKQKTKLTNIRYPKPRTVNVAGFDQPLHVYEGKVAIRATLEVPSGVTGPTEQLEFQVRYQACNDERCLAPTKVVLNGKVPVAKPGEQVKNVNDKLFRQAKATR